MREHMKSISGIVISPVETYRNLLSAEEKLGIPFVIVAISGLIEGLFSFLQFEAYSLGIEVTEGVIVAILAWTGIAGILHLILKASGREGRYKRLLELTGYISVITVLGIVTGSIAMFINILLATLIVLIFGFWCLWLYVLAVRENYQRREVPEKVIFKEPAGIGNVPIIVTFAVFVFLLYSSLGYRIGYIVSGMLYFIWWGIITSSHGIWRDKKALLWISAPTIVILLLLYSELPPLFRYSELAGLLWLGLALYAYTYHIWCNYHLNRTIPSIRLDILSLVTVAVFIFLMYMYVILNSVHFIITMLFPLWWLAITMSYKSWYMISTWIWACIALVLFLLVPPLFMILDAFYAIGDVISIFFAVLFAYSASYYLMIKWRA
ncbi:MAG: YIP1 family protein [Methanomicrobia archaeon]|nr:YIP1 family protein [Methanomicrobia archaeon]